MTIFTQSRLLSKVLSIFSLLMLFTANLMAQFCLGLDVRPDDSNPDEIFLDLKTQEFVGVASMQFSINYDPSTYEFIGLAENNLANFSNNSYNDKVGILALAWYDNTTAGVTFEATTPLISFKFKKLKESNASFDFAEDPTAIEVVLCPDGLSGNCEVLYNFEDCNTGQNLSPAISGRLYLDENKDCELSEDEKENGLKTWSGWTVSASQNGEYYFSGFLKEDGSYQLKIFPGVNTIEITAPGPYYNVCQSSFTIHSEEIDVTNDFFENLIQITEECPFLEVNFSNISSYGQMNCDEGFYVLNYVNNGTADATDVYIDMNMDYRVTVKTIDEEYIDLGNSVYRINIGDLPIGERGFIFIEAEIPCDVSPEEIFRNEAQIYPKQACGELANNWSGASLKVDGRCEGNQIVFEFENIGNADMVGPRQYVVIEDAIIYRTQNVQLEQGDKKTVSIPATGATYFIQVEQESGHPGTYLPSAFVEACGQKDDGTFSTGFANRFPEENNDFSVSIDYQYQTDSDESSRLFASPIGFNDAHYIEPDNVIEYSIHFKNTSTGVQIVDELSSMLDVTTFKPLSASSPYEYTLEEGILTLNVPATTPDAFLNRNSFVKFSVKPKTDLPMGSVISNTATLNYSEEWTEQTNTVFHTIEEDFLQTSTSISGPVLSSSEVTIYPNPSADVVVFTIKNKQAVDYQLSIFDVDGKKLQSHLFNNHQYRFKKGDLPTGTYLYRLIGANGMVDNGFFVLVD